MSKLRQFRSAITGRFVAAAHAFRNPSTTVSEQVEPKREPRHRLTPAERRTADSLIRQAQANAERAAVCAPMPFEGERFIGSSDPHGGVMVIATIEIRRVD